MPGRPGPAGEEDSEVMMDSGYHQASLSGDQERMTTLRREASQSLPGRVRPLCYPIFHVSARKSMRAQTRACTPFFTLLREGGLREPSPMGFSLSEPRAPCTRSVRPANRDDDGRVASGRTGVPRVVGGRVYPGWCIPPYIPGWCITWYIPPCMPPCMPWVGVHASLPPCT